MQRTRQAIVQGIVIDTTTNSTVGNRSASFLGGFVGIGVTEPTVALDVAGGIKGTTFTYSGAVQDLGTMTVATVNNFSATTLNMSTGTLTVSGRTVSVDHLRFSTQTTTFDFEEGLIRASLLRCRRYSC